MFTSSPTFSSFSVADINAAHKFYSETLGLTVEKTPEGLSLHLFGGVNVFIYQSPTNKPADFTVLNFIVEDIEKAVDELTQKGVTMEHYDLPYLKTNEKGIVWSDRGPKAMAWFKDPAGNILSVLQE